MKLEGPVRDVMYLSIYTYTRMHARSETAKSHTLVYSLEERLVQLRHKDMRPMRGNTSRTHSRTLPGDAHSTRPSLPRSIMAEQG